MRNAAIRQLPKYAGQDSKRILSLPIFEMPRVRVKWRGERSNWGNGHVINNAGIFPFGPTHEMTEELFDSVYSLNVKAPYFLVAELAPLMAKRGKGAIVNVSIMVSDYGVSGMSLYGSSKAAINLLTKAWAAEYGPSGVRVNTVTPGPTRTEGTDAMGEAVRRARHHAMAHHHGGQGTTARGHRRPILQGWPYTTWYRQGVVAWSAFDCQSDPVASEKLRCALHAARLSSRQPPTNNNIPTIAAAITPAHIAAPCMLSCAAIVRK
jgi:NAD(P)-dependent dehydrogenase (short-subunit alcohol dehydrogenase family)